LLRKLNLGSGQRKFDTASGWINIDSQAKWQPDVVADISNLSMFDDWSVDVVVLHHVLEHFGCGEANGVIHESHRVLKPGGSLLVFIPDPKELARRYLSGEINEYIFNVNMYGAYMGDEADRHKWSYSRQGLVDYLALSTSEKWSTVHAFNWRDIPGADIARDWWIIGMEAIK
jgi:predicted SAM-dependent methyltransferase